ESAGRDRRARLAHHRRHRRLQRRPSPGRAGDGLRRGRRRRERHPVLLVERHGPAHQRARRERRADGAHLALLRPRERRPRRPVQLAPRRRDPRRLLPEPPRRGEPDPRAGLDLREQPEDDLPQPRQPAEERGAVRARRAALAAGALAALAVAAGVALVRSGERPAAPAAAPAPAAVAAPPPAATRGRVDPAEAPLPPLPASLAGTEVDGDLRLENGRFVAGPEALALFDYFLSATGEEPDEIIRARIVAEIRRRLPPDAAREAEALLDRYLAYREAARELFTRSDLDYADVEKRFQLVRELRREQFGAELAAALFGEEEHVVAIELERRRVLARDDLDPAE